MGTRRRTRAGALVLSAACFAASCGGDSSVDPVALDVRVVYVSRLPVGATAALEFTVTSSGTIRN
jgi:hypothetical protein